MPIAYLTNRYPATSHTFIRREINALEELGLEIDRYSIRDCGAELVDPSDKKEHQRTTALVSSIPRLLLSFIWATISRPCLFLRALQLTLKLSSKSRRGLFRHLIYLIEACRLREHLSATKASHLHAHFGTNSATVAMLSHILGGPEYSFTVHGPEEFDGPAALSLGEKIAHAKFVVAISQFGCSQLFRWCDYQHWEKIHEVHCVVDRGYLDREFEPIPDVSRMVCVGRLCEQKGQLLLVEAAGRLAKRDVEFELILVGDGPFRGEIESLTEKHGIQDRVKITGWMTGDEVQQQLLEARVLVLPSFAEGLPVVIMEALALGRPVISTYIAGIPELVKPGKCGWLVPAGAIEPLVDAMQESLEMPIDQLAEWGKAGCASVRQRHNACIEAAKLAKLIQA